MRIKNVFKDRRSVHNFREEFVMTEDDFEAIFELARYSPSAFNTQGTEYLVVIDKEKQKKLKEISFEQHKILSASGVIIVLSEKKFFDEEFLEKVYRPSVSLGMMTEEDLHILKSQMKGLTSSEHFTEKEYELEMYRNTFLNVGILISIITIFGFDTCPMNIQNKEEVRKLFNIPDNLEIMFLLPVGIGVEKQRPRGYRKQLSELVTYGEF